MSVISREDWIDFKEQGIPLPLFSGTEQRGPAQDDSAKKPQQSCREMGTPTVPAKGHKMSDVEFVCLNCTLPECHESLTCPYWIARGEEPKNTKSRWASLIEEVRNLEPGGLLVKELSLKDARSAQSSVIWHVREGKITHNIKTWRIKDAGLLNILRKREGG